MNYQVQKISQSYEKLRAKKQHGDRQADVNLKKVCLTCSSHPLSSCTISNCKTFKIKPKR